MLTLPITFYWKDKRATMIWQFSCTNLKMFFKNYRSHIKASGLVDILAQQVRQILLVKKYKIGWSGQTSFSLIPSYRRAGPRCCFWENVRTGFAQKQMPATFSSFLTRVTARQISDINAPSARFLVSITKTAGYSSREKKQLAAGYIIYGSVLCFV